VELMNIVCLVEKWITGLKMNRLKETTNSLKFKKSKR
jgi:hypothetical protein